MLQQRLPQLRMKSAGCQYLLYVSVQADEYGEKRLL
jgi:hypothetical protein